MPGPEEEMTASLSKLSHPWVAFFSSSITAHRIVFLSFNLCEQIYEQHVTKHFFLFGIMFVSSLFFFILDLTE